MSLEIEARCRKCEGCLRARSAHWRHRALAEFDRSRLLGGRTWFGTLTCDPDHQYLALLRAQAKLEARGVSWSGLSDQEQFIARHNAIGAEITKWLKRVRASSQVPLRYILVAEQHQSGLPHHHLLVHECDVVNPVRKAVLQSQWKWGFSNWKLADEGSARYVCKYLAKSALARVRASARYGEAIF